MRIWCRKKQKTHGQTVGAVNPCGFLPFCHPFGLNIRPPDKVCFRQSRGRDRIISKENITRSGCKDVFCAYGGYLEIPCIKKTEEIPNRLIPFSKAVGSHDYDAWVHFYEDDVSFERLWNQPNKYLHILKKYAGVISPDFSVYRNMPLVMQQWNIYRSRAIGHWLLGIFLPKESEVIIMNITSVGYFREMVDGSPNDPSIKDYIDKGNDSIIDKVCTYLNSGIPLIVSPGKVLDIIDETKGSAGSPSILTDGKWAWSGVLSYYVKNYNLRLNDEFLETMISNGWQLPISENELDYSNKDLDGEPI